MYSILNDVFDDYGSNTVNINVDTLFLNWNFTFPAVSVCFHRGRSTVQIKNYLENYWSSNNLTKQNEFRNERVVNFVSHCIFSVSGKLTSTEWPKVICL